MICRALALCMGAFGLMNVAGGVMQPHFDATLWWLDLRGFPSLVSTLFMTALAAMLLAHAYRPAAPSHRRTLTGFLLITFAACIASVDAVRFFVLAASHQIQPGVPMPLSLPITIALLAVLWDVMLPATAHRTEPRSLLRTGVILTITMMMLMAFPVAQMFFFGKTDYRRSADAIIVLGARAYADGRPSLPLADRVRTACDLYHEGYAPLLIFSGGPGDADIHETQAMRDFAIALGVPQESILLDPQGTSTAATAMHTSRMLDHLDAHRVLVVSHFYHLPRIKLAYQRLGRDVYTVPARESRSLRAMPAYLTREIAAIWWYYVQPLFA